MTGGINAGVAVNGDKDKEACQDLEPTYVLGFRSCGRIPIDFASESVVIYPVAHHLVLYNLEDRSMEFFHQARHIKCIQSFQLSPDRELVAMVELSEQSNRPLISTNNLPSGQLHDQGSRSIAIYNLNSKTRVQNIPLPAKSNVVSCSFSTDNKFLAVLEDAPAYTVSYWQINKAKLVASYKCPSRGSRIHISPTNASFVSVSGPTALKYWIWTNNDFKSSNFLPSLKDHEHFVDHSWREEHMIALSERGLLLCFRLSLDGCSAELIHSSQCHQPTHIRMECLTFHEKGLVLGGSAGFFSMYEASDDPKDPFSLVGSVSVGDIDFDCIKISPSSETIVACSKTRELTVFSMSAIDVEQKDKVEVRELIRHGHQVGSVLRIDVCLQRPIVVTCGTDKTVRVWNFALNKYELLHQCIEEPMTVALHPSGFQVVIAFKERIRVYQLLHDSLRQVNDLPIKTCRVVRYAHGGHLFACASGLTVAIFQSYTFNAVHTFSGHLGAIRCLSWSQDDLLLYSAAHDGAIYRWDIRTGLQSEEMQHVVKQCQYAALVVDQNDASVVIASGSDGKIRELTAGEETTSIDLPIGTVITSMALTKDGKRLFAGTTAGSILVYTWPLTSTNVAEYYVHAETLLQLRMTEDDEQLLTCAEDGSVGIFKLLNGGFQHQVLEEASRTMATSCVRTSIAKSCVRTSMTRPISSALRERSKVDTSYTDAVLMARDDLEERCAELIEWQERHDQVKADVEFALHQKENEWMNRLHVLKEESEHLVVQERVRYEELEARHQLTTRKHTEEVVQLEARHVRMTQELENQYERKLAQGATRYNALVEKLEQTRQRCAALVETQDSQNRDILFAERSASYAQTKEQNEVIKRLHEDLKYNHVKFKEVLHQEETDYEQEMHTMRAEFAAQLEIERQNAVLKQGQVSAANTKLESLKKKMQELKASSHTRDILLSTERANAARLEAILANYERQFEECRDSEQNKEKAITGLKSENRVLENFRLVLSHRIDGLETEQAPMQEHLRALETRIREMHAELADAFQAKTEAQQEMDNKDAKIRTLLHEVKTLRQSSLKREYIVGEMTREFTRLTRLTNYKDLESAVKDAFKVYVMGETLHKKPSRAVYPGKVIPSGTAVSCLPSGDGLCLAAKPSTKASKTTSNQSVAGPVSTNVMSIVSNEALGYDCKQSVDESVKQMECMSRTIQTLRTALEHANSKADRTRRDSVVKGSKLIEECNRLRKDNTLLQTQIRALCAASHDNATERISRMDSSKSPLQISHSSPQLHSRPASSSQLSSQPDMTLSIAAVHDKGSMNLTPLHTRQRRQRTPNNSSSKRNDVTLLPFERARRGRHDAARADELADIVDKQKRDIQRLHTQVDLLLSGAADAPLIDRYNDSARMVPSSSTQSITSQDATQGAMIIGRIGSLRPLI